ncbi:VUT family protein [Enterovibrio nigricans]|uniref:Queuosine precursor transporter n=1 Tax=Enterovibrio nigricans DSM 22720 TaxID=1121868 RepID=A0A1T4W4M7_9GAMM|nr:VUT family protein [Enterovibrio nigricans]SKA72008.1 hypothetical protein SAMN02745132_04728 [Enterovibrio nigricans DSM 22720]
MKNIEKIYIVLTLLLSVTLIVSNLSAIKVIEIYGYRLTAGFFSYPFVYVFCSIIIALRNKYHYVFSILLSYFAYFIFTILMFISMKLNGINSQNEIQVAFESIFDLNQMRIFVASSLAYLFSFYIFGIIFSKLEHIRIDIRLFVAILISSTLDVTIFLTIAFLGSLNFDVLVSILILAGIKRIASQIILFFPTLYAIKKLRGYCDKDISNN